MAYSNESHAEFIEPVNFINKKSVPNDDDGENHELSRPPECHDGELANKPSKEMIGKFGENGTVPYRQICHQHEKDDSCHNTTQDPDLVRGDKNSEKSQPTIEKKRRRAVERLRRDNTPHDHEVSNQVFNNQEFVPNNDDDGGEKSQVIIEKKRRRRESHAVVKRRRQDNINENIQELFTLLPEQYTESAKKPLKGTIIRKSMDYIRDLKEKCNSVETRRQELEEIVRELESKLEERDKARNLEPDPELEQMIRDLKSKLDIRTGGDLLPDGNGLSSVNVP